MKFIIQMRDGGLFSGGDDEDLPLEANGIMLVGPFCKKGALW